MIISPVLTPPPSSLSVLFEKEEENFSPFFYYQRGTMALAYSMLALLKKKKKQRIVVLFPDYFCREPLEVFKTLSVDIRFYPIQENFEPDWKKIEILCYKSTIDALVLVHYFGFENNATGAKRFCDENRIDLIEDCTHQMYIPDSDIIIGACAVWSPWKFMPLPFLGCLKVDNSLKPFVESLEAQNKGFDFIFWYTKHIFQKVFSSLGINWYRGKMSRSNAISYAASPARQSRRLLVRYSKHLGIIRSTRVRNYRILESFFREKKSNILSFRPLPESVTPYMFPCILKKPAMEYVNMLVDRGVPATLWPDLPDEVRDRPDMFPWAHIYAKNLILLPIHQGISEKQMSYMKRQIEEVIG